MRKKIEEIIEQSFDVVRIGNKVYYTSKSKSDEKFKRRIEELLTLNGVGRSWPSKEEVTSELKQLDKSWKLSEIEDEKQAFNLGFRTCLRWLRSKAE